MGRDIGTVARMGEVRLPNSHSGARQFGSGSRDVGVQVKGGWRREGSGLCWGGKWVWVGEGSDALGMVTPLPIGNDVCSHVHYFLNCCDRKSRPRAAFATKVFFSWITSHTMWRKEEHRKEQGEAKT